ncbi:MAG TPA: ABC transporter substrate-binding protein [Anaerolineaceae bacterium]|jgi:iron complex transport system substrate-binding protein|nr:ABC transporter substrate-binding protein [Anaerolineaceae bacterium]
MKKILTLLAVLIIFVLPACQVPAAVVETEPIVSEAPTAEAPESTSPVEEATQVPAEVEQVSIDYAKNFTLEYKDGYKLLTVTLPWLGATESLVYALIPNGTQVDEELGNAVVIHTPIDSFVSFSSTYLPFLEQIGELNSLIAVDTADYIYNADVRLGVENGSVTTVGSGPTIDVETVVELAPDLIMTSASGSADWDTHPVLEQAGLPVVINSDYLEQDPLGRAEWGKFIAAFYDKEAEADQVFDAMAARYEEAKASVAGQSEKVTVFVNTAYEGTWYMPGGESYAAILLSDAGADYLWNDLEGTGAMPIDFEVVVERAKDADFWLNVGFASDLASLAAMDPRYVDFKAYQEGKVFNNNARITEMGGTDYFESGTANPDAVLRDLIAIFYPDLAGGHELYYYRQLQ